MLAAARADNGSAPAAARAASDLRKVSRRIAYLLGIFETAPSCAVSLSFGCPGHWGNY